MIRAIPVTRVTTSTVSQRPNLDSRLLLMGARVVRMNPLPEGTTLNAAFFTVLKLASHGPFQSLTEESGLRVPADMERPVHLQPAPRGCYRCDACRFEPSGLK